MTSLRSRRGSLVGRRLLLIRAAFSLLVAGSAQAAAPSRFSTEIQIIRAVGPEGLGNTEASAAWKRLAAAHPSEVVGILNGMDGANELAVNWLRAAVEVIAERESAGAGRLGLDQLTGFVSDPTHDPRARRLAFELIRNRDAARARTLLREMVNDSSLELRRDAVQSILDGAKSADAAGDRSGTISAYRLALNHARDLDQIDAVSKRLGELGESVDLAAVFGWVTNWQVIGPFDSTAGRGFEVVYPPETGFDPAAGYEGKAGKVRWMDWATTNEFGTMDLNRPLGKSKGVAGYARAEFVSQAARPVELRLGTENALKVWLNGELLFAHEEYHRAAAIDQYRLPASVRPGTNVILVKLCQNEQTEDWAEGWEFQLRVTDKLGTPIIFSRRTAVAEEPAAAGKEGRP